MFRKLIKYEWVAMMRSMIPVYIAMIAVSLLNGIMIHIGFDINHPAYRFWDWITTYFGGLMAFLYATVMMVLIVFTCIMIIQRFYKGILGREGYLMLTLPVKTWELVFSKALVSFFVSVCSIIVAILSICILGGSAFFRVMADLPELLKELIRMAVEYDSVAVLHMALFCVELVLAGAAGFFASAYQAYLSMSLGQLARSHKVAMSVVWYIGISNGVGMLSIIAMVNWPFRLEQFSQYTILHILGIGILLSQAIPAVLYGIVTDYILKRKLNLE